MPITKAAQKEQLYAEGQPAALFLCLGYIKLDAMVRDLSQLIKGISVIQRDGALWIKTKSGEEVSIEEVEAIKADGSIVSTLQKHYAEEDMSGKRIAAMFQPEVRKITLVKDVAGIWSLSLEFYHFLEDINAVSNADKVLLNNKIAALIARDPDTYGYLEGRSNEEKRADYVCRTLVGIYYPQTAAGKIIQKIKSIIDRIVNALGIRTAEGIIRDIKTGRIYDWLDTDAKDVYCNCYEIQNNKKQDEIAEGVGDNGAGQVQNPAKRVGFNGFIPPVIGREKTGSVKIIGQPIHNSFDAAQISHSYISKFAKENLISIVLSKDNKVLHIYRHTIGFSNQSQVSGSTLIGEVLNTPGAEAIYLAHNHPSESAARFIPTCVGNMPLIRV